MKQHLPSAGRFTTPSFSRDSITGFAILIGIANPIPSTSCCAILLELIPIISPFWLNNAPPLLPGLIAASV